MLSKEKKYFKLYILGCTLLLLAFCSNLKANVFADVNLSKSSVYVQEPFRVTITVYTTTWFTAPLEFGNLQIPNAFIVPFDKTQPGMFGSGNKQYPGVQFYYIVFPYQPGEFTIPAFEITAHSPADGSATAQTVVVHTKEYKFTVRDVPQKLKEQKSWLVAKDVDIKELWSPALKDLKVGDVIKRTIVIDAKGTLPQFIPDISGQEVVKWASTYLQDAVLTDLRSDGDANGRSTQVITYLLEQKGSFKLPAVKISYWDPVTNKILSRSTPDVEIEVVDNPNLGILKTLKDSLEATQKSSVKEEKKGTKEIFGLRWYSFLGILAIVIAFLFVLIKVLNWIYKRIKKRKEIYLNSEKYYFRRMMTAGNNPHDFLPALYLWWDRLGNGSSASIVKSLEDYNENVAGIIKVYLENAYTGKVSGNENEIKQALKEYREIIKKSGIYIPEVEKKLSDRQKKWI